MTRPDQARPEILRLLPELSRIRRDIHEHPELGFEEHRTQALCRDWMEKQGLQARSCAGTGLIVDLGPEPSPGGVGRIGLRCDLDALPMHEHTELPYRSVHPGVAHKCGHDGHTTIMLGVAAVLAQKTHDLPRGVRLLFQPAEEGVRGGGAKVMVSEGALEDVDEVYGLHNWPGWSLGELRVCAGPLMAAVHSFSLRLRGRGGHASQPQACRDVVLAASATVVALQQVVSRGLGSGGGGVLSVCTFHAGETGNVLPNDAELSGTIRTFSEAASLRVLERTRETVAGVAQAYGVEAELALEPGYPLLVNDPACAEAVRRVAAQVPGIERVSDAELPMAGGEDFAYFAQARPSAYFFLGAGRGPDTPGCHHADFDFDEALIPLGIETFVRLAEGGGRTA